MKILLTGCCGFIGFNFANYLINSSKKVKIIGLDNLNNYYSTDLKKKRLLKLKKHKRFSFQKIDINEYEKLLKIFDNNKFNFVFNFAAQANVRYSFVNPKAYVESNINGFFNILDLSIKNKIKKVFYASSSSIYGDSKKFPTKEKSTLNPKNIYGLSKKINEDMAEILSAKSNTQCIGLRFFTIYGEWGRPDMFLFKYLESCFNPKKVFRLNNFGNHLRDFTYIKDVCEILKKLMTTNIKNKHIVFNISSNNPIKITKIIDDINFLVGKKAQIKKIPLQTSEMYKTHGDNSLIKKMINKKKFTSINIGLKNTVDWFVSNKDKIKLY